MVGRLLFFLLCIYNVESFGQCTNCPKANAEISTTTVSLIIDGIDRNVPVSFIKENNKLFVLPILVPKSLLLISQKGTSKIIDPSTGLLLTSPTPFATRKSNQPFFLLTLTDISNSAYRQELENKLTTILSSASDYQYIPRISEAFDQQTRLSLIHRLSGLNTVSEVERNGQDEIEVSLPVDEGSLSTLSNHPVSSLQAVLTGSFNAEFSQRDFEISAEFLKNVQFQQFQNIASSLGTEKILFVPAGGSGLEQQYLTSSIMNSMQVNIRSYQGANNKLQPEIIELLIRKAIDRLFSREKLETLDDDARLVFMLDKGLTLSSTVSSLKAAKKNFSFGDESTVKQKLKDYHKNSSSGKGGGKLDVIGIFEIGGDGESTSNSESNIEREYEALRKFEQKLNEELQDGSINFINGINFQSLKKLQSDNFFESQIDSWSNVRDQHKSFRIGVPMNLPKDASNEEVNGVAYDLYSDCVGMLSYRISTGMLPIVQEAFKKSYPRFSAGLVNSFAGPANRLMQLASENGAVLGLYAPSRPVPVVNAETISNGLVFRSKRVKGNNTLYTYIIQFKEGINEFWSIDPRTNMFVPSQPPVFFNMELDKNQKIVSFYCDYYDNPSR